VRLGLAALVAFVLLALPAPALAGSILFVRAGDVWISTPDGTTERQLTVGGGFASPSMADDGTIVALRGRTFVRLRPDGAPVGMPLDAVGGDWIVGGGPYDARVSPDGLKVAYWFTGRRRSACRRSRAARCRTPTSPATRTPTASPTRSSSASCADAATPRGTARVARSCSGTARAPARLCR
jgi:hypothetical protein